MRTSFQSRIEGANSSIQSWLQQALHHCGLVVPVNLTSRQGMRSGIYTIVYPRKLVSTSKGAGVMYLFLSHSPLGVLLNHVEI